MDTAAHQKRTKTSWPTVSQMSLRGTFALFCPFRCVQCVGVFPGFCQCLSKTKIKIICFDI